MKLAVPGEPHLTYCTNIHPGETWAEVRANLERHVAPGQGGGGAGPALRGRPAAVRGGGGRRWPARRSWTRSARSSATSGLYVFTINGFPYGPFHGTRVKEEVYLPDWLDDARLAYSDRLAELLAALLPDEPGLEGTVSTVPGAFKGRVRGAAEEARMAELMVRHAAGLHRLWERTGKTVSLALEPEPCCHMETVDETVRFFEGHLFAAPAVAAFGRLAGLRGGDREAALRRHLGVCFDACHMAVEFEDAAAGLGGARARRRSASARCR